MDRKFARIKNDILGKDYALSIAFVNSAKSRELNKKYRKKDRPTNVLSFALGKKTGELVLCPAVIRKEAKNFGKTYDEFLGFLVIHGCLHLKGSVHSSRMEREEAKYDQKYFGGHRRRLVRNSGRRGRMEQRRKKS